jgi:myb proto-oncogene protein
VSNYRTQGRETRREIEIDEPPVRRQRARTMKPGGGGGRELSAWVRKGPWTAEEDEVLRRHVLENGPREWSSIRSKGLLPRTGKSCRLRWVNKLRPDIKK